MNVETRQTKPPRHIYIKVKGGRRGAVKRSPQGVLLGKDNLMLALAKGQARRQQRNGIRA